MAISPADAIKIVEAVLSHARIKPFLHLELKERLPVALAPSNIVTAELDLRSLPFAVRLDESSGAIRVELKAKDGETVTVGVDIPEEGLSGVFTLIGRQGDWRVSSANAVER